MTADDFAPEGLEAQAQCFFDNGFVIVRNALPRIAQIQTAWEHLELPAVEAWEECRRHGVGIARHSFGSTQDDAWPVMARKWFGLDDERLRPSPSPMSPTEGAPGRSFVELDESFVDFIDAPQIWPIAERVLIGPREGASGHAVEVRNSDTWQGNRGELRCTGCSPRTYPPDRDAEGYTYWHRDEQKPDQWPFPKGRIIKMFFYTSDVTNDGGPLAVVPMSHRLQHGPWETLRRGFKSSMTLDAPLPQECMPNHVKFTGNAGDALLFDTACWHTAMPNVSNQNRRAVIMGWAASETRW